MVINRFEIGVLTHLLHGLWVHLSLIKLYDSQYCITTSYLRDCFINKIRGRSTVAERFCCRTLVGGDKVHNVRKFVIDRHLVQIGHFILGNRNPRWWRRFLDPCLDDTGVGAHGIPRGILGTRSSLKWAGIIDIGLSSFIITHDDGARTDVCVCVLYICIRAYTRVFGVATGNTFLTFCVFMCCTTFIMAFKLSPMDILSISPSDGSLGGSCPRRTYNPEERDKHMPSITIIRAVFMMIGCVCVCVCVCVNDLCVRVVRVRELWVLMRDVMRDGLMTCSLLLFILDFSPLFLLPLYFVSGFAWWKI